ncbi:MAG: hypothetical protein IMF10_06670 [Proteobacteria bacterium]|nr:hypothetical protein [Pseudomonadota bacterium]
MEDVAPTLERIKKNFDHLSQRLQKRCTQVSAKDFTKLDFSKLELRALKHNRDFQTEKVREISKLKGKELYITRKEMLNVIGAEISLAQGVLGNVTGQFYHFTEPPKHTENLARMGFESKCREIRDILRGIDPEQTVQRNGKKVSKRIAAVEDALNGDKALDYLHSLISSPDSIIAPEALMNFRFKYTVAKNPELATNLEYGQYWYRTVRELLASYNSEAVRTLMLHEMDAPITMSEFAEVFVPQTSRDREIVGKRILEEQRARDRERQEEE